MNKAIIFYSKSGNTRSVSQRLNVTFQGDFLEVKAENDDPNIMDPVLKETPDVKPYDHIVFASPVHGFMLAKVMLKYLNQADDLFGKKVDLFVTHYFPFQWMGGTQTLKQMKRIVELKHGEVHQMISVNWKSKRRESVIENLIKQIMEP